MSTTSRLPGEMPTRAMNEITEPDETVPEARVEGDMLVSSMNVVASATEATGMGSENEAACGCRSQTTGYAKSAYRESPHEREKLAAYLREHQQATTAVQPAREGEMPLRGMEADT